MRGEQISYLDVLLDGVEGLLLADLKLGPARAVAFFD
jgi:hypothetical protein